MNYLEIDQDGLAVGGVYTSSDNTVPDNWVEISSGASIGWVYANSTWTAPAASTVSVDELRTERNRLLVASDFTQLLNAPFTDVQIAAWATYREELRDLLAGYTPVENPTYPTEPSS